MLWPLHVAIFNFKMRIDKRNCVNCFHFYGMAWTKIARVVFWCVKRGERAKTICGYSNIDQSILFCVFCIPFGVLFNRIFTTQWIRKFNINDAIRCVHLRYTFVKCVQTWHDNCCAYFPLALLFADLFHRFPFRFDSLFGFILFYFTLLYFVLFFSLSFDSFPHPLRARRFYHFQFYASFFLCNWMRADVFRAKAIWIMCVTL